MTIPKRFPQKNVAAFVEQNRRWIESVQADIDKKTPALYKQWPPRWLNLQALGEHVELIFDAEAQGTEDVNYSAAPHRRIHLKATADDRAAVAAEVTQCLKGLARQCLPLKLAAHARRHGLQYRRVQIRAQRTVWGSYSTSGTLSLNYKLLFLKPELVDYVLLHELAHTLVHDHSARFWQHLESLQSNARQLDARLASATRDVPPWL